MTFNRRTLFAAGLGAGTAMASTALAGGAARAGTRSTEANVSKAPLIDLEPNSARDQTAVLQAAIDAAALRRMPLALPPGRFRVTTLALRPGTRLIGTAGLTEFEWLGGAAFMTADAASDLVIEDVLIDGGLHRSDSPAARGLIDLSGSDRIRLRQLHLRGGSQSGIVLDRCSGSVRDCHITQMADAGLHSLDATGLEIAHNTVTDCSNNGIQVWRRSVGEDGTLITANRIERIAAVAGGSGENGNGINIFRAANVLVSNNRIADCAYSAIRGNAATNVQMIANSASRIGEVALYAEFGFEGALIASNIVDTAASGIAVTNFNEGGRLAVVQGNLIRNLFRREQEPEDKRGIGISVEADSLVTGNTVERAATCGIIVGWGRYLRDCVVSTNLVRDAAIGILLSADADGGSVVVQGNLVSGARHGAIRAMDGAGLPIGHELTDAQPRVGRVSISGNSVTHGGAFSRG
ncbi:MAG: TIGR03808 family TAT-translocated repetitive protein [Hyphomicrobium sp.]